MRGWSDDATEQFLAAAADDLQSQIRSSGVLEGLAVDGADDPTIVATIRVGRGTVTLRARGENLLDAYGELRRSMPERLLAAAFREYVGRP